MYNVRHVYPHFDKFFVEREKERREKVKYRGKIYNFARYQENGAEGDIFASPNAIEMQEWSAHRAREDSKDRSEDEYEGEDGPVMVGQPEHEEEEEEEEEEKDGERRLPLLFTEGENDSRFDREYEPGEDDHILESVVRPNHFIQGEDC